MLNSMKKLLLAAWLVILIPCSLQAQIPDSLLYKEVDSTSLYLYIDYPPGYDASKSYPAIVFFFGGGWNGGTPEQFAHQASYFSDRGMLSIRADYRVKSRQGTTPFESLQDAKSAMRYVRAHAGELGVNPDIIVASGGSAGGHLAAATALIDSYNEEGDELSISCIPDALVLFNPVIDNGPGGYGFERIGEAYHVFSPLHNIRQGAPPTIIFLGTEDQLIPVETVQYYKKVMEKVGSRCDLFLFEGEAHGFFNYGKFDNYQKTLSEANQFLISLGYLYENPVIEIE